MSLLDTTEYPTEIDRIETVLLGGIFLPSAAVVKESFTTEISTSSPLPTTA